MTDTPNNSLNSAEQFLNEIECELASISFEEDIDMESDLVSKSNNSSSNHSHSNGHGDKNQNCPTNNKQKQLSDIDSRKSRNRMMQLYITIANNENNNNIEIQNDDTKSSLPYFTIVNNNECGNHKSSKNDSNNKQQFLKKLDEKEIANLKSIMLNTELDEICHTSNNNNDDNNKMLVICSPINSKTNDMIDTLLAKLEKQIEYSMNNSSSVSTTNSMDFQHMTQKTKELKQRMITLQNKFAILRQKRALQHDIHNNDFTAYNVNSPTKQQQTQQKQKDLFRPSIKHVHFPNDNESESVSSSIVSLKQWKQHEIEKLQNKNKMMAHQHKKIHQIDGKRTSKIGQNFYKNYGKFYQLDTNDYFQKLQKYGFKNNKLHSKHNNNNKNNNNNNWKSHKKTQEIRERSASIHVQCNSKNKPTYQAETLNHTLRKMRAHPKIRTTRMPWRG